jgi:N-methylhydantoinase A/oxoprolinase/acetone carboxylase beta subunit
MKWSRVLMSLNKEHCERISQFIFEVQGTLYLLRVYRRDLLKNGNSIEGPALIEEHASTTVVQPGDSLQVDLYGNLQISIGAIAHEY